MSQAKTPNANHAARLHSKIGASSMYRWARCPGSVALCETIPPRISSAYAEEGTKAHEVAEAVLQRELFGKKTPAILDVIGGAPSEMRDAVQVYVDWALAMAEKPGAVIHIEHGFDLSAVHPGLFGTADFVAWLPNEKRLVVGDYKHGAGIPVSPNDNPQLKYYALGALITLGYPATRIECVVIQPRCQMHGEDEPKIRSWECDAMTLLEFSADLVEAAKATEAPNAPLNPGDHCRFCPGSGVCPKLESNALEMAKTQFGKNSEGKIIGYSPERLTQILAALPEIEAWAKSVREFAYAEAMAGRVPVGFKLVEKRATRQWVSPIEAREHLLSQGLDEADLFEEPALKSPAQIEKLVKGGKQAKENLLSPIVKYVSSGMTLVPESDKRQGAIPGEVTARKEFAAIE